MIHILGNLACETEWRGGAAVPAHVATRIAALATVMRALVADDDVTVWTDVAVDPARIPAVSGLSRPALAVGVPPPGATVLAWGASARLTSAQPPAEGAITTALDPALCAALAQRPPSIAIARQVNDRRFAMKLARELGCGLAGASVIGHGEDVEDAIAAAAAASPTRQWVAKLPLSSAGRDRAYGGTPIDTATRSRVHGLLQQGVLVVEPWLDRRIDLGITGAIERRGEVRVLDPHQLVTDSRGGFRGIDLAPPPLTAAHRERLRGIATAVGHALAEKAHRGPFTIDAFVHADRDGRELLHPLVEINARLSFGVIARALGVRLGATRLGLGTEPPADARILVAPAQGDPSAAWVS